MQHCFVRLSPIVENSSLLPPIGVLVVSQSQRGSLSFWTNHLSSP
ncbi:hypothetical protein Pint_16041 [Pistacia integerrima]|uniref:Uncharacterized protein n=1 Tax=Pistacia integerrima TaxID=434235 RepID=A0ACC0ZFU6_9ROSI|nr:hypothetical protein Pint_16041 [Pistacia integerrima]